MKKVGRKNVAFSLSVHLLEALLMHVFHNERSLISFTHSLYDYVYKMNLL